jgi:hypothetical protein
MAVRDREMLLGGPKMAISCRWNRSSTCSFWFWSMRIRLSGKRSSTSSYMASFSTISLVMFRALPVRCLCKIDARYADSRRASRDLSLRREAATKALDPRNQHVARLCVMEYIPFDLPFLVFLPRPMGGRDIHLDVYGERSHGDAKRREKREAQNDAGEGREEGDE